MDKYNNFTPDRCIDWGIEGVRQLMSGNIRYSNLYFSVIDRKYFADLLQSLIHSQAPLTKANTQIVLRPVRFRWFCHCFASYFNIENKFDAFLLIQPRFISTELQTAHDIRIYLRNPNITKDTDMKLSLAKSFINLIEDNRPLSIWLRPHLNSIFSSLNTFELYNRFHFNMFTLFEDCSHFPESDISKIDFEYTDPGPYHSLFMIPQVYTNTNILNIIERYIFKKYHFPIPTNFAGSSLYISLVNTSFSTKTHFIDLFQKHVSELYANSDFQNFKKFTGYFGSFQPWFFASVFHDKCPTLPYYFEKPEFKYENISTEFLYRLYNDRQLFQTVREITGTTSSCINFLNHSIPYLFFQSTHTNISMYIEPIENIKQTKFFIVSDEGIKNDTDFCYCYFILFKLISSFSIQIKDDSYEADLISQIEAFINSITSIERKNSLFRDILSLIFIKDADDQFICPFNIGSTIIKILLEMNDEESLMPYIKSGYQRFNLVCCLNLSPSIDSVIYPNKYQLLDALLKDDIDIAKYLACINSQNEQLFQLSTNVKKYSQKEPFNILQSDESTIKEIALSFDDKTALRYSINFDTNEIEHELFTKRFNESHPFLHFQKYPEICKQLSDFDTNIWKKYEINENLPLLHTFYSRLGSFIPISLRIKFGETVKEVLLLNPRETIINLLKSNQNEKSEEIAKKLNIDIFSVVFSGDFSEDVIFHFSKEYPVVGYASTIANNQYLSSQKHSIPNKNLRKILYKGKNEKENVKIQYVRNHLLNMKQTKNDSQITFTKLNEKTAFYDSLYQEGTSEEMLLDCLDELYKEYPKEKDLLLDIRYRVDEDKFKQRIKKHMDNQNLKKIRELFCDCLFDTDKYDFLIGLGNQPFPLESTFRKLIDNNEYEKCKKLYDYFSDEIKFDNIINDIVKDRIQNHKSIENIMKYFPSVRENIISSFSFEQISEFDSDIQNFLFSIPEDWMANAHPNVIVANHINEYSIVRDLLDEFSFLNIDDAIINLIEANIVKNTYLIEYDQVLQLVESIYFFLPDIRDTYKFIDYIMTKIKIILSSLETNLNNELIYEITLLRKSIIYMRNNSFVMKKYSSLIDKIECLYQISLRQLYSKFQQKTSFHDFEKNETGQKFAELCLKYDDVQLLETICYAWNLNFNSYLDRRISYSYQLSIYENDTILDYSALVDPEHIVARDKLSGEIVNILSHALFYDQIFVQSFLGISLPIENLFDFLSYSLTNHFNQAQAKKRSKTGISGVGGIFRRNTSFMPKISTSKVNLKQTSLGFMNHNDENADQFNLGFYERLQNIIQNRLIRTKDQRMQLEYFLEHISSPSKAIMTFVSNCNLKKAVEILNKIDDQNEKKKLFSKDLFETAIYFDDIERLRSAMKITPDYAKPYLQSILESATESNSLNLKLSITQFLNLHDYAAETAIELYNEQSGNYQNMAFLDIAQIEIALELRIRKQGKKEGFILSTEKLNDLMKKIDLQRKYNMFVCEKKLKNTNFSAFGSDISIEPMVFLLFKEKYFELAFEFVFEFQIPMSVIGERIIDILISESEQSLIKYISVLEENGSQNFFREILYSMINRIISVFRKFDVASEIIHKSVSDTLFKCQLMVQFNMIDDAAEIAFKNNFSDLIPVIANQAYFASKKELIQKCIKYLENAVDQENSQSTS